MAPTTQDALTSFGPLVLAVIWRLVSDREAARDIYQETFLSYHGARGGIDHPKAWLCVTARRAAFRHLARARREVAEGLGPCEGAEPAEAPRQELDYLIGKLRHLVADLPPRQREVFAMRHFEDLPFAEIADQLGCSEDAARASDQKARRKVRELLQSTRRRFHV